ncbi:MAG: putative solute-binding protein [Oleiphilaceae bacterium]|nr:putative solute-binding protein [Oleiphilaceae bacterium]
MGLPSLATLALTGALSLIAFTGSTLAQAQSDKGIDTCVFDIIGSAGDQYQFMQDYALRLREHGLELNLKPYTDEGVALADFSAGKCDILAATDIRTRRFNRFAGTIGAVGAIPSYDELETVLAVLASEKAADYLSGNGYHVMGVFPMGAGYLFVTDRSMDTVEDLAGKRIAALNYHPDAIHMINYVGASVEPSDITNFGGKFNNRSVDAAYAPAMAYEALELYRGVRDDGGIVRYPLGQLTAQIIARDEVIDKEMALKARKVAFDMFDDAMEIVKSFEEKIPEEVWIDIPDSDIDEYQEMFRQNRIQLRDGVDSEGKKVPQVYHGEMLTLLRKVRCRENPDASECTAPDRE